MSDKNPESNQKREEDTSKNADNVKQNDSAQGLELENLGGYERGGNQQVQNDPANQNWQGDKPHTTEDIKNEEHQWQQQTAGMQEEDFDKSREPWVRGDGNSDNEGAGT